MPVRIEILGPFFEKKELGHMMPKTINVFPNYTPSGERELLVFKTGKKTTTVYLANPEIDEVDIEEKGIDMKNFQKLKTLRDGEALIREAVSENGKKSKVLRFTHVTRASFGKFH